MELLPATIVCGLTSPTRPDSHSKFSLLLWVVVLALTLLRTRMQRPKADSAGAVTPDQPRSIARQAATDRAMTALVQAKSELGRVFVDGSVLALAPAGYVLGETVWGGKDRLLFPRQAKRAMAQLPHARLVELPGAGHLPMWDDPEGVLRELLAA